MTTKDFNQIVHSYADPLYRYAVKLTGNQAEAEDVVQDMFEKVWIKRDQIKLETVKAMCYKITHNIVMDNFRRKKIENALPKSDLAYTNDQSVAFETANVLEQAFAKLQKEYKSLILLRDYEGYTYEEIAKILNMTLSQVKVYLYRARKQMQQEIKVLEITVKL